VSAKGTPTATLDTGPASRSAGVSVTRPAAARRPVFLSLYSVAWCTVCAYLCTRVLPTLVAVCERALASRARRLSVVLSRDRGGASRPSPSRSRGPGAAAGRAAPRGQRLATRHTAPTPPRPPPSAAGRSTPRSVPSPVAGRLSAGFRARPRVRPVSRACGVRIAHGGPGTGVPCAWPARREPRGPRGPRGRRRFRLSFMYMNSWGGGQTAVYSRGSGVHRTNLDPRSTKYTARTPSAAASANGTMSNRHHLRTGLVNRAVGTPHGRPPSCHTPFTSIGCPTRWPMTTPGCCSPA
jgi:hypothetical protein